MSGPVGPGPFPPDQPHTPVDLRRDGHASHPRSPCSDGGREPQTTTVHRSGV